MCKDYEIITQNVISMVFLKKSGIKGLQMTCNEVAVALVTVSNVTVLPVSWLCTSNRHWIISVFWVLYLPISHALSHYILTRSYVAWTTLYTGKLRLKEDMTCLKSYSYWMTVRIWNQGYWAQMSTVHVDSPHTTSLTYLNFSFCLLKLF